MGLPFYLAMTAAEIHSMQPPSDPIAYMACHFSPYGTGLSNLPERLDAGSLLMVNDRIPFFGHDPQRILAQLRETVEEFSCGGVVLDLQRDGYPEQQRLCQLLTQGLACPVAVSELYASGLDCPIFLSPPELHRPLSEHIAPCLSREVWLEAALDAKCFTVTQEGCTVADLSAPPPDHCFTDEALHCRYTVEAAEKAARFRLWRTADDLKSIQLPGVTRLIGLYQEFMTDTPWG